MSERLRELLIKAVDGLEEEERREVLGELLVGATGHQPLTSWLALGAGPGTRDVGDPTSWTSTLGVASGDMKLLPVRLPTDDYERLRAWSRENGFSMAVIIRTLVERFLNEQQGRSAKAS